MGTASFPGVKRPRRDVYRPSLSSTKVKEREELYFYSPSVASWHVIGELYHYGVCKLVPYPKTHLMTNSEKNMGRSEEGTEEEKNTWLLSSIHYFFSCGLTRAMASSFLRFLDHTQWRITVGRIPLDEWSARRRDLLKTYNTHNRQISMPPVEFEPTISAGERPQTYASDRAATGTGAYILTVIK